MSADLKKYEIYDQIYLGLGSFGDVFLGINKEDGTQYAFKLITHDFQGDLRKEVDIMQNLNHENIIKYYGKGCGVEGYRGCIVMEYCNKGSLRDFFNILNGLCDNMFLLLLECFSNGLAYLRQKELVHRDIKPDNVLIHEDDVGNFHMKLADLGEAKAVKDSEMFESLVGTPKYLHPELYLRYIRHSDTESHNIYMDLWSVAVTLYESVVTTLPFMTDQNDKFMDADTLKCMYLQRSPGHISCKHNSANEQAFEWSNTLPTNCRLSTMLRNQASVLIGNLMDSSDFNTYERFFSEAKTILKQKRVLTFCSWNGQLELLYLNDVSYACLSEQIVKLNNLSLDDIFILTKLQLLYNKSNLTDHGFRSIPINRPLTYQLTDYTVLVIKKNSSSRSNFILPCQYSGAYGRPTDVLKSPAKIIKTSTTIQRFISNICADSNYIDCQILCFKTTLDSFNNYIRRNLKLKNESAVWNVLSIREQCGMLSRMLEDVRMTTTITGHYDTCRDDITSIKEGIEKIEQKTESLEKCMDQYFDKIVKLRELEKYVKNEFKDDLCSDTLDNLLRLTEHVFYEVKLLYRDSTLTNEAVYKQKIWQRQIRQYNSYQLANGVLDEKIKNVIQSHKRFSILIKTPLDIMERKNQLLNSFRVLNRNESALKKYFVIITNYFDSLLNHPNEGTTDHRTEIDDQLTDPEIIKNSIREIEDIVTKIKSAFILES